MTSGEGFRADPTELAGLASQTLTAADGMSDALTAGRETFAVPVAGFGDTAAASGAHRQHEGLREQVGTTTERLVQVLEGDVDRIYRVAFAYQKLDQEAAADLCRRRGGGPTPC